MKMLAALGLLAGGFGFVPRDLLVIGVLWVVGQFSPSMAATLFLGALMMWLLRCGSPSVQ